MKNKQQNVKTYISEANQNRISDTLFVKSEDQSLSQQEETMNSSASNDESDNITDGTENKLPGENNEPEALSAEAENLPPNSASADAEAVAGLPIGGVHGHEGD